MSEYAVISDLGKGSFSTVVKASNRSTGQISAIKIISKNRMKQSQETRALLNQEIEVVQQINHPCIIRVHEVLEDDHHFYIVCELLCEELSKRLYKRGAF